jgi:hypothetical protein
MTDRRKLFQELFESYKKLMADGPGVILSVQFNQSVKSKGQIVPPKLEKCAVQK